MRVYRKRMAHRIPSLKHLLEGKCLTLSTDIAQPARQPLVPPTRAEVADAHKPRGTPVRDCGAGEKGPGSNKQGSNKH